MHVDDWLLASTTIELFPKNVRYTGILDFHLGFIFSLLCLYIL